MSAISVTDNTPTTDPTPGPTVQPANVNQTVATAYTVAPSSFSNSTFFNYRK